MSSGLVLRSADGLSGDAAIAVASDAASKASTATAAQAGAWTTKGILVAALAGAGAVGVVLGVGLGVGLNQSSEATTVTKIGGEDAFQIPPHLTRDETSRLVNIPQSELPSISSVQPSGASIGVSHNGEHVWIAMRSLLPGTLWAASSDNAGATMRKESAFDTTDVRALALSADGKHVYAATTGLDVMRSEDFGASFAFVETASDDEADDAVPTGLAMSHDGETAVLVSSDYALISTSFGKAGTWSAIAGLDADGFTDVAVSGSGERVVISSHDGLFVSTNGGGNFTDASSALSETSNSFHAVAMDDDGTVILVAERNGYIHRSSDGGHSFERVGNATAEWLDGDCAADGSRCVFVAANLPIAIIEGDDMTFIGETGYQTVRCFREDGCRSALIFRSRADWGQKLWRLERD
jgi:hypothetical protein